MNSDDVTREQAEKLKSQLTPMLLYLGRLKERLNRRGFPPGDPLARDVASAYDAVHALRMSAQYSTVGHGVGREERSAEARDQAEHEKS